MTRTKNTILHHYNQRHILITGSTGFLGKVLLVMMLDQLPNLDCIYLLIRKNKKQSASSRFGQEILTSPAFTQLSQKKQTEFKQYILNKVKVLEGDITQPGLGLAEESISYLSPRLDLIIHSAALVDFTPDIRSGLTINVQGPLNVAEFTKQCQKARLIHVSTCYVVGNQSGLCEEKIARGYSPNGLAFDEELEVEMLAQKIKHITEERSSAGQIKNKLKMLGCERAVYWGWSNTYCYTKAIAELMLEARYPELSLTIIRPSIIASAVLFPFAGWNEGINGTVPLTIAATTKYPYLVARKHCILDIIPVDLVSHAILIIGAEVLKNASSNVYQIASSAINPCFMSDYVSITDQWYRNYLRNNSPFQPVTYFLSLLTRIKCITANHVLAPSQLISYLTAISPVLHSLRKIPFLNLLKEKLFSFIGTLRQMEKIIGTYKSFIYDHTPIFSATKISQLLFEENQFLHHIKQLNWHNYVFYIHLPGLDQWIFSFLKQQSPPSCSLPCAINKQEEERLLNLWSNTAANDSLVS